MTDSTSIESIAVIKIPAHQLRAGMVLADGTPIAVVEHLGKRVWVDAEDDPLHVRARTFDRDDEVEVTSSPYDF